MRFLFGAFSLCVAAGSAAQPPANSTPTKPWADAEFRAALCTVDQFAWVSSTGSSGVGQKVDALAMKFAGKARAVPGDAKRLVFGAEGDDYYEVGVKTSYGFLPPDILKKSIIDIGSSAYQVLEGAAMYLRIDLSTRMYHGYKLDVEGIASFSGVCSKS